MSQTPVSGSDPSGGVIWKAIAFGVVALTLLGSAPSAIRLYHMLSLGLTWNEVPFARQQRALWQRNLMCLSAPGEQAGVTAGGSARELDTFFGVTVRLQSCPNGDVLVRTVAPDGRGRAVWVAADAFDTEERAGLALPRRLRSDGGELKAVAIRCQEWANGDATGRHVVRVVSVGGVCTRETIDVFNGNVLISELVPCDVGCTPAEE